MFSREEDYLGECGCDVGDFLFTELGATSVEFVI